MNQASPAQRKIIHVDMDAFYASVEQRDRPEWRDQPLIVGGSPDGRGVVAAASYAARRFGIRSAMSAAKALRLCPQVIVVQPDFTRYRQVSAQIHQIFASVTSLIEPLALDEAYLDVTTNHRTEPSATRIAEHIKHEIQQQLGLIASAGVGPNKLVAKIASDADKPDGLCVVPPAQVEAFLAPLPARALPGIGPKASERCALHHIRTIGDVRTASADTLFACFGNYGEHFRDLAWGRDQRPVRHQRQRKSVGIEDTFSTDITELPTALAELDRLVSGLYQRLKKADVRGRTITLKVKYDDFSQITRSHTLSTASAEQSVIAQTVHELVQDTEIGQRPVRLLGISVSHLDHSGSVQLELDWGS